MGTNQFVELPFDLLIMNYLWQYPWEAGLEGLAEDLGVENIKDLRPAIRRLTRQGLIQQVIRIDNVGKWEGITLDSRVKDRDLLGVRREAKTRGDDDQPDESTMAEIERRAEEVLDVPELVGRRAPWDHKACTLESVNRVLVDSETGEILDDEPEIENDCEAVTLGGTATPNLRDAGLPTYIDDLFPALTRFQDILFPYHLRVLDGRNDLVQVTHSDPDPFAGHYIHNGQKIIDRWREQNPDADPWQPYDPVMETGLPPVWPVPDKMINTAHEWGKRHSSSDTLPHDWTDQLSGGHIAALEQYIGRFFWNQHKRLLTVLELRRISLTMIERNTHPRMIVRTDWKSHITGAPHPVDKIIGDLLGGWYKDSEVTPDTDFVSTVQRPFDFSLNGVYKRLREHLPNYLIAEYNTNTSNPDPVLLATASSISA